MGQASKVVETEKIIVSNTQRLAQYCPDLENWPRSWSVEPRDIAPGQQLLERFKPFLSHLLDTGLSRKTLLIHRDNLWILGGDMIRDFYENPPSRKRSADAWLDHMISHDGGPLMYHCNSEEQQRSFDSTCRRFYKFRINAQPKRP